MKFPRLRGRSIRNIELVLKGLSQVSYLLNSIIMQYLVIIQHKNIYSILYPNSLIRGARWSWTLRIPSW
jgi:hypothetical protein